MNNKRDALNRGNASRSTKLLNKLAGLSILADSFDALSQMTPVQLRIIRSIATKTVLDGEMSLAGRRWCTPPLSLRKKCSSFFLPNYNLVMRGIWCLCKTCSELPCYIMPSGVREPPRGCWIAKLWDTRIPTLRTEKANLSGNLRIDPILVFFSSLLQCFALLICLISLYTWLTFQNTLERKRIRRSYGLTLWDLSGMYS